MKIISDTLIVLLILNLIGILSLSYPLLLVGAWFLNFFVMLLIQIALSNK